MQVTFTKPYFDAGVRVFQPGESLDLPDERAAVLAHHGVVVPVVQRASNHVEHASAPRRPKRETR